MPEQIKKSQINLKLLIPTMAFVLFVAVPLIYYSQHPRIQEVIAEMYRFVSYTFGWSYILIYLVFGVLMFYISFSPYGKIKLGGKDAKPQYNFFHWASMIIAAGHGIALVNWVMVEPLITNALAPLGKGTNASSTFEVALAYTFFHWGPFYWVIFLVAGVPLFYFLGVRQRNRQCVSMTIEPLIGTKQTTGFVGILCDVFTIVALAAGIGTTLTVAVQLVSGLLVGTFGFEKTQMLEMSVLGIFTLITLMSLLRPLSKGMRVLSDCNSIFAMLLLALVLVGGPTSYFFNSAVNLLGSTTDNFLRISGWTDPFGASGYPQDWTIFYGAWIYAYAPMMGIFFASISMGRTLREVILGVFFFGSLSTFVFCSTLGAFSLYVQYEGIFDLYGYYISTGKDLPMTVSKALTLLPFSDFIAPGFLVMCTIFLATTIDASTRVLASMTTQNMYSGQEPSIASKIGWCLAITLLVLALLLVGGLPVVQALCVASAVPLVGLGIAMNFSMWKVMTKDFSLFRSKKVIYFDKDAQMVKQTTQDDVS